MGNMFNAALAEKVAGHSARLTELELQVETLSEVIMNMNIDLQNLIAELNK